MKAHNIIAVLGEALIDCVIDHNDHLTTSLGGSPYNLCRTTALQEIKSSYINPFSSDHFGQKLKHHLQQAGVTCLSPDTTLPTSLALVTVKNGNPRYSLYRDQIADRDYKPEAVNKFLEHTPPGLFHTGSLMLLPPEHETLYPLLVYAKHCGWTISLDLNIRPQATRDLPLYLESVRRCAELCDWLKASDEDLAHLGMRIETLDQAERCAKIWHERGCQRIAITCGAQGAYLQINQRATRQQAYRVPITDTIGAGDVFWGTCLADWIAHDTLTDEERAQHRLAQTLDRALKAAAFTCMHAGCQPPTRLNLEEKLA